MSNPDLCPCGSGELYEKCCGVYHSGAAVPETPEQLMRSRYSAYVKRETDLYTQEEKKLLGVKPGITDLSSIVFSDEGEILKDSKNPDLAYNQLIRPWKTRLAYLYVTSLTFGHQIIWKFGGKKF